MSRRPWTVAALLLGSGFGGCGHEAPAGAEVGDTSSGDETGGSGDEGGGDWGSTSDCHEDLEPPDPPDGFAPELVYLSTDGSIYASDADLDLEVSLTVGEPLSPPQQAPETPRRWDWRGELLAYAGLGPPIRLQPFDGRAPSSVGDCDRDPSLIRFFAGGERVSWFDGTHLRHADTSTGAQGPPIELPTDWNLAHSSWSDDGGRVIFANSPIPGPHSLATLYAPLWWSNLETTRLLSLESRFRAWRPGGRELAYIDSDHALVLVHDDGSEVPLDVEINGPPVWAPDGGAIAWTDGLRILVAGPEGDDIEELAQSADPILRLRWIAGGERLLLLGQDLLGYYHLSSVAVDGSTPVPQPLAFNELISSYAWDTLTWSPDGEHVLYVCGSQICLDAAETGITSTLIDCAWAPDSSRYACLDYWGVFSTGTTAPWGSPAPVLQRLSPQFDEEITAYAWSPDSQRIAWRGRSALLAHSKPNLTQTVPLTLDPYVSGAGTPLLRWSEDGEHLYYGTYSPGLESLPERTEVYRIAADGSDKVLLSRHPVSEVLMVEE